MSAGSVTTSGSIVMGISYFKATYKPGDTSTNTITTGIQTIGGLANLSSGTLSTSSVTTFTMPSDIEPPAFAVYQAIIFTSGSAAIYSHGMISIAANSRTVNVYSATTAAVDFRFTITYHFYY